LSCDARIDAYIAKAQPFARPILEKGRERVHAVVPEVEEAMKWGHPTYLKNGKIILGTAAFKEHAALNFWRGKELGLERSQEAMGQLGRLTGVADLPSNLDELIARAAELASNGPAPAKPKRPPKPMPRMHPDFAAALDKAPKAKATMDGFPPSCRRDYLEWIAEAKQDATRQKRIATAIDWLSDGKRRNWKYETC
jgi:uncharacterized protein YdeI (YjbR/CyaY-like superfamily)